MSLERTDGMLKTTVTDTGIGISPEKISTLFQKFQTVKERFIRSREYGSGMGLYISKILAESMSGGIRIEKSAPGEGTSISFTLPLAS